MEKVIFSLMVIIATMTFSQSFTFAEISNSSNVVFGNSNKGLAGAKLVDQGIDFKGQGSTYFTYSSNSGTEQVHIELQNKGSNTLFVKLKDSKGTQWLDIQLDTGKSYTTTYDWSPSQAGDWDLKVNNGDGSKGSIWLTVHSGV